MFKRTIPTSRRGVVTLFVSTLNEFQLRHNFEIGSELKIDWSNNQGKESQNEKLGVPTTIPSQKDFRYFFFRWNKDVVFPPRFGCFASISITFLKNLTFTLLLSSLRLELIGMASITVYPKLLKMGIVDKTLSQQFKQFNKQSWLSSELQRWKRRACKSRVPYSCFIDVST